MVNYARVQNHVDKGLAKAGRKLGAPFNAYRVTATATGDYPIGWTLVGSAPVFRIRIAERELQSALKASAVMFYQLIGGMSGFLLGDVFVNVDPSYVPGVSYGAGASFIGSPSLEFDGFSLVGHPPVGIPTGARLDRRAHILRPLQVVDAMGDGTPVWRQTSDQALALTLTAGAFAFAVGAGSWIPIGISSTERPPQGENFSPGFPGQEKIPRYYAFIPYLPGWEASEGDRIVTEDGAVYRIVNPYRQEAGITGNQLSLERVLTQNA